MTPGLAPTPDAPTRASPLHPSRGLPAAYTSMVRGLTTEPF